MKTTRSKDGTTLAYDVYGNGPALIFITGATCFRSMEPVLHDAKVFAEEFTVSNYDRRGRGDSGNTLPYTIQRELEDIEAMIDAAGSRAYVYGHFSGAILALEAALLLGGKVSKLTMYDPPYVSNEGDQKEFIKLSERLSKMLDIGKNDEAIHLFLTDPNGVDIPEEVVDSMRQLPLWESMAAIAPTLVYDTTIASRFAPIEQSSKLNTPTQIIVGEQSPAPMHEVASKLSEVMPNATYSQLAGQDHMPNPEVLLPLLSGFLK